MNTPETFPVNYKVYTLAGQPTPWMRAGKCGKRHYDQQKHTKMAKGIELMAQHGQLPTFTKPLRLVVVFYFPMPATMSEPKKALLRGTHHSNKPDGDNLEKFLLDLAKDCRIIRDDCIIASVIKDKLYSDNPRTEFVLMEL